MHLSLHFSSLMCQLELLFHLQHTWALFKSLWFLSQSDFCRRNFSHPKIIKPRVERGGNGNRLEISGEKTRSSQREKELASSGKHDASMNFEFILSFIALEVLTAPSASFFLYSCSGQLWWGGSSEREREGRLLWPNHFDYIACPILNLLRVTVKV